MLIKGEYARSIPENTEAEIRFGALEFANAIVLVTPDSPTSGRLANGAIIPSRLSTDMIEEARNAFAEVSRDLRAVVTNLKTLSSDVADTGGSYNRIVNSLLVSTNHAERIMSQSRSAFETRQSMAGLLLNENGGAVRDINHSLQSAGRTAVKFEAISNSLMREMDTVTAVTGQVRSATARLPNLIVHADSTLTTVDRTVGKIGNSWFFSSNSRTDTSRGPRSGSGY
jgi:methyl-accepting chemotaxis protein